LQDQKHKQKTKQTKSLQTDNSSKKVEKERKNIIENEEKTFIEKIYTRNSIELNLATHNINGLKSNNQKMKALYTWALDNNIDIVRLAEMNITAREENFLTKDCIEYKSFWTSANSSKKKGLSIEFLISKQ